MTAPAVKGKADKPGPDQAGLSILPKAKLIAMILEQREETRIRLEEKDQQITELSEQLTKLQGEIDQEKAGQKIKEINQQVNQPTGYSATRPKLAGKRYASSNTVFTNWRRRRSMREPATANVIGVSVRMPDTVAPVTQF